MLCDTTKTHKKNKYNFGWIDIYGIPRDFSELLEEHESINGLILDSPTQLLTTPPLMQRLVLFF